MPETSYNLIPGIGGISRMSKLIGRAHTVELALHGNTFAAAEALKYKLVDRILPKHELIELSLQFAGKIALGYKKEKGPLYLKRYL